MPRKTTAALGSKAIMAMIYLAIEGVAKSSWVNRIALRNDQSDQKSEEYPLLSQTPQFREWVAGRDARRLLVETLTLVNRKYEATVEDFVDNWRFDASGMLQRRVDAFATRAETHWAKLICDLLPLGQSTLTYDDQNYFSTSHSFGESGTLSNLLTNATYAELDVATPANPTAVEMANALNAACNHFFTFRDDQGEPMNEDAERFLVVCPINHARAARAAVGKELLASGSTAISNPLTTTGFQIDVVPTARLTATNSFYVFREDAELPAVILQEKQPGLELTSKAEGSDYEHDKDMWQFGAKANRAAALFGWQSAIQVVLN